jgi:antitoxin VapB
MKTYSSRPFRSGNSQAVRLPKEIAFEDDVELIVSRSGDVVTMMPKPKISGAELVRRLEAIGPPPDGGQERQPIDWPERPGL